MTSSRCQPRKRTVGPAMASSRARSGPSPITIRRRPDCGAGRDRLIDSLVRDERRDHQVAIVARHAGNRAVEIDVHGGLNHPALAAVTLGDPLADRFRDRHEMGHAAGRRQVPAPEPLEHRPGEGPAHRAIGPAFQVGLTALPGVSHRSEAIADVRNAGRRHDGLGHAMAQADDEVDVLESPGARGQRHDRQQMAIVAEDAGNELERRRPDLHRFDRRTERAPPMDQGIKLRFGKGAAEHLEAFLAPAHSGQPVVHECNPEPGQLRRDLELGFKSAVGRRLAG